MHAIRTLGHGTLTAEEFAAVSLRTGIQVIVDVRRSPASRRHPQFGGDEMAQWLPLHGLEYRGMSDLGGRRAPAPRSPNVGLRNDQFRAYADHMASEEFRRGVAELVDLATTRPVAVVCAESVWWRCHRRLLADHLVLVAHVPVEHLFHDGRVVDHAVTPEARRSDDHLVYDLGAQEPLFPSP